MPILDFFKNEGEPILTEGEVNLAILLIEMIGSARIILGGYQERNIRPIEVYKVCIGEYFELPINHLIRFTLQESKILDAYNIHLQYSNQKLFKRSLSTP